MTPPPANAPAAEAEFSTTDTAETANSTTPPRKRGPGKVGATRAGLGKTGAGKTAGKTGTGGRRRSATLELRVARLSSDADTTGADAPTSDEATGAPKTTRRRSTGAKTRSTRARSAAKSRADSAAAEAQAASETAAAPATGAAPEPVPQQPAPAVPIALPVTGTSDALPDAVAEPAPAPGRRMSISALRAEKRAARAARMNDASNYVVAPTVGAATMQPRHYGVIALFCLMVVLPTISYGTYLWTHAANQYESKVGFGSRTEQAPSTFDFLGALGGVGQSGSKDMDILNQFVTSQELVAKVDQQLDLKAMFAKAKDDPLHAFKQDGTIEDLVAYWQHMIVVNYDNATGLMNLQIYAFDPQDAQNIAKAVLSESTRVINDLSQTAQEDTTRYSKEALEATEKKLSDARRAVMEFQVRNNLVDPSSVIASQLSVVGTLNQQMAAAQIDLDMLTGTVSDNDPRIAQLNRRIEVIRNRIEQERAKVGAASGAGSDGYAKMVSEFEQLKVEQEFSEKAYLSALAAYDQALTDAQHKTRYLATFVEPTLAEASTAPNRPLSAFLVALSGFLSWAVMVLVYYALRDRR